MGGQNSNQGVSVPVIVGIDDLENVFYKFVIGNDMLTKFESLAVTCYDVVFFQ